MAPSKHDRAVYAFDMAMSDDKLRESLIAFKYLCNIKSVATDTHKNDTMQVFAFNVDGSKLDSNIICLHKEQVNYSLFSLDDFKELSANPSKDWFDIFTQTAEVFKDFIGEQQLYNSQLVIFTDLSIPISQNFTSDKLRKITDLISSCQINLYVLGPQTKKPKHLHSRKQIQDWLENLEFSNGDNIDSCTSQNILKLVKTVGGVMCEISPLGVELVLSYTNKSRGKQPWKVPLTISEGLDLDCLTCRSVETYAKPKITGGSKAPDKWVIPAQNLDEVEQEVDVSEKVDTFKIHGMVIDIPKDIKKEYINFNGERMLKLIGFVDSKSIPDLYLLPDGESHHINVPQCESTGLPLTQLINSCLELDRYGLAIRVYSKGNKPRLYLLKPRIDEDRNYRYFEMTPLADSFEISADYKEEDINLAPAAIQTTPKNLVGNFLDSLLSNNEAPLHPTLQQPLIISTYMKRLVALEMGESPDSVRGDIREGYCNSEVKQAERALIESWNVGESAGNEGSKVDDKEAVKLEKVNDDDDEW